MAIFFAMNWDIFGNTGDTFSSECFGITPISSATVGRTYPTSDEIWSVTNVPTFPAAATTIILVGMVYQSSIGDRKLCSFLEGATVHFSLYSDASGFVKVYRGDKTTLLGTSSQQIPEDTFFNVSILVTISDTVGIIQVYENGTNGNEWINLSGLDTNNGGASGIIDGIEMDGFNSGQPGWVECVLMDDSGSVNNAIPSDHLVVDILSPDGAGNASDWTPLSGTNWAAVDDEPISQSVYNESTTNTHKDTHTMASVSVDADTIAAVIPFAFGENTSAGAAQVNTVVRHSASESAGADISYINIQMQMAYHVTEVNPSTASAWTPTEVNAMECGYELSV